MVEPLNPIEDVIEEAKQFARYFWDARWIGQLGKPNYYFPFDKVDNFVLDEDDSINYHWERFGRHIHLRVDNNYCAKFTEFNRQTGEFLTYRWCLGMKLPYEVQGYMVPF